MRILGIAVMTMIGSALASSVAAAQQDTMELERLRRQMEAITRELEEMRLGREVAPAADSAMMGFGPAASKVYRVGQGVSIGGYGEVLYQNFAAERQDGAASGRRDEIDALRGIVYVGYKFNDRILFNSEIEIEHANEIGLEFAYVDYRVSEQFGLRGGLLLVPMGFINELHEPPVFLTAKRPETESQLIPSTWRENGVGVFGDAGPLAFRAYVVNGLDGSGFTAGGFRGGRQKGSHALSEDMAVVGRVDYTAVFGLQVGGSAYLGGSGQNMASSLPGGGTIGARTLIWEGHVQYQARGVHLRGLFAQGDLDDAEALNEALGLTGTASLGSRLVGWYAELGYDVLRGTGAGHQLIPYARYEALNTQHEVPGGSAGPYAANPANDRQIVTFGAGWKPLPNVVLKGEYQLQRNEADTGVDQVNVQLGYLF
jgi:hypothetical protein